MFDFIFWFWFWLADETASTGDMVFVYIMLCLVSFVVILIAIPSLDNKIYKNKFYTIRTLFIIFVVCFSWAIHIIVLTFVGYWLVELSYKIKKEWAK